MTHDFAHHTPVQVRFRDIDAFGHVNNAVFLSYVEQARVRYLLDTLEADAIQRLPLILARLEIDFRAPILLGESVEVGSRVEWIGRSSFGMRHLMLAGEDHHIAAEVASVLVTYDYELGGSIAVPDDWQARFVAREGRPLDRAPSGAGRAVGAGAQT